MSMPERAYVPSPNPPQPRFAPERQPAPQRVDPPPHRRRHEPVTRPLNGRPQRPSPQTNRRQAFWFDELRPLATILSLAALVTAGACLYLTAFARMGAVGTEAGRLDRDINRFASANAGLQTDIQQLQRRDRVEREARRLGLVAFTPASTRTVPPPNAGYDQAGPSPATTGETGTVPSAAAPETEPAATAGDGR